MIARLLTRNGSPRRHRTTYQKRFAYSRHFTHERARAWLITRAEYVAGGGL